MRPTRTRLVPGSKQAWCKNPLVFAMIAGWTIGLAAQCFNWFPVSVQPNTLNGLANWFPSACGWLLSGRASECKINAKPKSRPWLLGKLYTPGAHYMLLIVVRSSNNGKKCSIKKKKNFLLVACFHIFTHHPVTPLNSKSDVFSETKSAHLNPPQDATTLIARNIHSFAKRLLMFTKFQSLLNRKIYSYWKVTLCKLREIAILCWVCKSCTPKVLFINCY